jgi:hypothetical protein
LLFPLSYSYDAVSDAVAVRSGSIGPCAASTESKDHLKTKNPEEILRGHASFKRKNALTLEDRPSRRYSFRSRG